MLYELVSITGLSIFIFSSGNETVISRAVPPRDISLHPFPVRLILLFLHESFVVGVSQHKMYEVTPKLLRSRICELEDVVRQIDGTYTTLNQASTRKLIGRPSSICYVVSDLVQTRDYLIKKKG